MTYLKKYGIFLIPVLLLIVSLCFYPHLPQDLPMQFSIDGSANWTLPKQVGILVFPIIQTLLILYYQHVPEKKEVGYIIILVMCIIQLTVLFLCVR